MCSKTGLEVLVPEDGCCGGWGGVGWGQWSVDPAAHLCLPGDLQAAAAQRHKPSDSDDLDFSWLSAGSSRVSHLISGGLRYRRDKMGTKASNYRLAVRIK